MLIFIRMTTTIASLAASGLDIFTIYAAFLLFNVTTGRMSVNATALRKAPPDSPEFILMPVLTLSILPRAIAQFMHMKLIKRCDTCQS